MTNELRLSGVPLATMDDRAAAALRAAVAHLGPGAVWAVPLVEEVRDRFNPRRSDLGEYAGFVVEPRAWRAQLELRWREPPVRSGERPTISFDVEYAARYDERFSGWVLTRCGGPSSTSSP